MPDPQEPPPESVGNDQEGLDLPDFVAHLLNAVANAGTRHWLQSGASLGDRIVDEIAVMTGFFAACDPEGQEVIRLINKRSESIYACLARAEAGISQTTDDLRFLERART